MQSFTLEFRVITDFIGYNEWFKDFGEYRIEDTINGIHFIYENHIGWLSKTPDETTMKSIIKYINMVNIKCNPYSSIPYCNDFRYINHKFYVAYGEEVCRRIVTASGYAFL